MHLILAGKLLIEARLMNLCGQAALRLISLQRQTDLALVTVAKNGVIDHERLAMEHAVRHRHELSEDGRLHG